MNGHKPPVIQNRSWIDDSKVEWSRDCEKNSLRETDTIKVGVGCLQRIAAALERISGNLVGIKKQLFRNTPAGRKAMAEKEKEQAERDERFKAWDARYKEFGRYWLSKCRTISGTPNQKAALRSKVWELVDCDVPIEAIKATANALDIVALFKPGTKGRAYAESIKGQWEAKP